MSDGDMSQPRTHVNAYFMTLLMNQNPKSFNFHSQVMRRDMELLKSLVDGFVLGCLGLDSISTDF